MKAIADMLTWAAIAVVVFGTCIYIYAEIVEKNIQSNLPSYPFNAEQGDGHLFP